MHIRAYTEEWEIKEYAGARCKGQMTTNYGNKEKKIILREEAT